MNSGNFSPEPHAYEKGWIPDYQKKDYVFCDLCKWIEDIPKFGDNKHWRNLWPVSLTEIQKNGIDSYEYKSEELRQEIISKIKALNVTSSFKKMQFVEAIEFIKKGKAVRRKDWTSLYIKACENDAIAFYNEGAENRVDILLNINDVKANDWIVIDGE